MNVLPLILVALEGHRAKLAAIAAEPRADWMSPAYFEGRTHAFAEAVKRLDDIVEAVQALGAKP